MMQDNPLLQGLRASGARITPQRIAICQWLVQHDAHPTTAEVYRDLAADFPTMSLATVYNTFKLLEGLDLLFPVGQSADGSIRYDAGIEPHLNLVCMDCGQIIDVMDVDLSPLQSTVAGQGFHAHDFHVTVHGLCAACQKRKDES